MSKIKAEYDSISEVPEQYADLYEERDGKAQLVKIDGLKTEADVSRVQRALSQEKELRRAAETSLSLLPDTPENILEEISLLKDKAAAPNQAHSREVEKLKQDIASKDSKVNELQAILTGQHLTTELRKEAASQGIKQGAIEDVILWGEKLFTVKDNVVVSKDSENMESPGDWLSKLKGSGKKEYWFESSTGGGAAGSKASTSVAGVEYFKKGTSSLQKMNDYYVKDPKEANRLAKLAGHNDFFDAIRAHAKK